MNIYIYTYTYVYFYACMYIYTYMCMYICIYIYMHVHIHKYIYIYIHTSELSACGLLSSIRFNSIRSEVKSELRLCESEVQHSEGESGAKSKASRSEAIDKAREIRLGRARGVTGFPGWPWILDPLRGQRTPLGSAKISPPRIPHGSLQNPPRDPS